MVKTTISMKPPFEPKESVFFLSKTSCPQRRLFHVSKEKQQHNTTKPHHPTSRRLCVIFHISKAPYVNTATANPSETTRALHVVTKEHQARRYAQDKHTKPYQASTILTQEGYGKVTHQHSYLDNHHHHHQHRHQHHHHHHHHHFHMCWGLISHYFQRNNGINS